MIPSQNVSVSTLKKLTINTAGKVHLQGRFRKTGNPCSEIFVLWGT